MSHIRPADFWQIVEQLKQTEEKLRRAEAQLKLAEEALEFIAGRQSHWYLDETVKAREALAKIRGGKCTVEE